MSNDKKKVEISKEFEKIMEENNKKKNSHILQINENKIVYSAHSGLDCYYRVKNNCKRYPPKNGLFEIVEGDCKCGEFRV